MFNLKDCIMIGNYRENKKKYMSNSKNMFRFLELFIYLLLFIIAGTFSFAQEEQTLLQNLDNYFLSLTWTESVNILSEAMPEPYKLKEINAKNISYNSDINLQEAVYPFMSGLGILDYSGIEISVLNFFNTVSSKIKKKKIEEDVFVKEKIFLPFFANYMFSNLSDIKNVFFSRPEYTGQSRIFSKFKCFMEGGSFYFIDITVVYIKDKWLIETIDFAGEDYGNAS